MLTDGCRHSPLKVVVLHCRRTRSRKALKPGSALRTASFACVRARAQNPPIIPELFALPIILGAGLLEEGEGL